MDDVCCLLDVKYGVLGCCGLRKGECFWFGKGDGVYGMGDMVKMELCDGLVDVRTVCNRVIVIVLIIEEAALCVCSAIEKNFGRKRII